MPGGRPYRMIDEVLEEFGVPNKERFRLKEATREVIDQHRAKSPEQMKKYLVGDVLPLPLASEFLMRYGAMIFDNKGELRWDGPNDIEVLRTGFAHIIGRHNISREEKLAREGYARLKRAERELDEGTTGSTTSGQSGKKQRRNAVASQNQDVVEDSTGLAELGRNQNSVLLGSPELPDQNLVPRSNASSKNSLWSISSSCIGGEVPTIEGNLNTHSQTQSKTSKYQDSRGSTLLPETTDLIHDPRSAMNYRIQRELNSYSHLPYILPCPDIFGQGKHLSISEFTQHTTEEELFMIECGGIMHQVSGEQCAKIIRLTIFHLNSFKADLALAAEQEMMLDCQARVFRIIHDIVKKIRQ